MINHITPDNLKRFQSIIDLSKTDLKAATKEIAELNRTSRHDLFTFADYLYLEKLETESVCKVVKLEVFKML